MKILEEMHDGELHTCKAWEVIEDSFFEARLAIMPAKIETIITAN